VNPVNKQLLQKSFGFTGLVIERCMQCMTLLSLTLFIPWTRDLGRWFYATLGGQGQINGLDAVGIWFTFLWIFIFMKFIEGLMVEAFK